MPSKRQPTEVECARPGCTERFVPQRSTARYHSATCRQRAGRQRKAAEHNEAEAAKTGTKDEHDLVKAVRQELARADKLMTVAGQLALQLARRAANPDEPSLMALSKELRTVMADALGSRAPEPGTPSEGGSGSGQPSADDGDEVTRAREARERKARQARKAADRA